MKAGQPVKLHGVDVRIMDEEQAWHLNRLRMKQNIHIAWDLPQLDLTDRLKEMVKVPTQYERDLARWANRMWLFKSSSFENYMPRKGFKCGAYLKKAG